MRSRCSSSKRFDRSWAMANWWLSRLLFRLEPERAHRLTLQLLRLAGALPPIAAALRRSYGYTQSSLQVDLLGLRFANPLGLAAGYDKDGLALRGLACLGFGYIELGTVTPLPQSGNPKPRLYRLPQERALLNRLGFPNQGGQALAGRLRRHMPQGAVVGVNLGKGAATPLEQAVGDYLELFRMFAGLADYLVVNVSSPNTVGLRQLQAKRQLERLLGSLVQARLELPAGTHKPPILVKLSPDLNSAGLEDSLEAITGAGADGVIACNTTVGRTGLDPSWSAQAGGLSGAPLFERATAMVRQIRQLAGEGLPLVAVGGVMTPQDARWKLDAGADLVQLYTGLVYRGPHLIREILADLAEDSQWRRSRPGKVSSGGLS